MVVDKEGRDVVHVIDDVSAKHHPKYLVLGQFGRKVRVSLWHTLLNALRKVTDIGPCTVHTILAAGVQYYSVPGY